jgi:hypothetical protein
MDFMLHEKYVYNFLISFIHIEPIPLPEYFPAENDVSFAIAEQNDWITSIIVGVILAISLLTAYD